jgi:prevent-host-death family protein
MEKTVSAYEARRKFGQLLEEAFYQKDHFVVERSGRPMAAIVPIDDYHKWQRLSKERVYLMLEEVWTRTQAVPAEELNADIEQALATLRQELRGEQSNHPRSQ